MAGRLPPVRLDIHATWYDLLLTVLHRNAEKLPIEGYREEAGRLINKISRFAKPYRDNFNAPCVEVMLYPDESAELIWQLMLTLSGHYEAAEEYSHRLTQDDNGTSEVKHG